MQPEPEASVISTDGVNYKKKYKTLKRKLRMLIYEQECFSEELRRAQRKLLRISRDKSFLLDRLLQYEKPEQNLSDSEATASSDSETEQHPPSKKKKSTANTSFTLPAQLSSDPNLTASMIAFQQPKQKTFQKPSPHPGTITLPQLPVTSTPDTSLAKKKVKVPKKQVIKSGIKVSTTLHQQTIQQHAVGAATGGLFSKPHIVALTSPTKQGTIHVATRSILPGHPAQTIAMTQEELERHLELKQSNKPQFMNIEKTPMLPDNIFSNENSNSCDFPDSKTTDDEDLVIDMP